MEKLHNRVIEINNKKTSICLEDTEWSVLNIICKYENIKRKNLIELINTYKDKKYGLTQTIRIFTLSYNFHASTLPPIHPMTDEIQSPIFDAIRDII